MNERIKEFAEEAGITTNLDTDYFGKDMNKWVDYYSEKFAQLIIQECVDVADNNNYNRYGGPGIAIREHFGVEE